MPPKKVKVYSEEELSEMKVVDLAPLAKSLGSKSTKRADFIRDILAAQASPVKGAKTSELKAKAKEAEDKLEKKKAEKKALEAAAAKKAAKAAVEAAKALKASKGSGLKKKKPVVESDSESDSDDDSDAEDSSDEASSASSSDSEVDKGPTDADLTAAIEKELEGVDIDTVTSKTFRALIEKKYGYELEEKEIRARFGDLLVKCVDEKKEADEAAAKKKALKKAVAEKEAAAAKKLATEKEVEKAAKKAAAEKEAEKAAKKAEAEKVAAKKAAAEKEAKKGSSDAKTGAKQEVADSAGKKGDSKKSPPAGDKKTSPASNKKTPPVEDKKQKPKKSDNVFVIPENNDKTFCVSASQLYNIVNPILPEGSDEVAFFTKVFEELEKIVPTVSDVSNRGGGGAGKNKDVIDRGLEERRRVMREEISREQFEKFKRAQMELPQAERADLAKVAEVSGLSTETVTNITSQWSGLSNKFSDVIKKLALEAKKPQPLLPRDEDD